MWKWTKLLSVWIVLALALAACGGGRAPAAPPPAETGGDEAAGSAAEESAAEPAPGGLTANPYIVDDSVPRFPEVLFDAVPEQFNEAPMLAEMVAAGDLPPVEERLPLEPMVIEPADEIGQYGGTWNRAFTGPADHQNIERIMKN